MPKAQNPTKTLKGDKKRRREMDYEEAYKLWRKIGPILATIFVLIFVYFTYHISYNS